MKDEVENTMVTGFTYEEPLIEPVKVGECEYCDKELFFHEPHIYDMMNNLYFCSETCLFEYEK